MKLVVEYFGNLGQMSRLRKSKLPAKSFHCIVIIADTAQTGILENLCLSCNFLDLHISYASSPNKPGKSLLST